MTDGDYRTVPNGETTVPNVVGILPGIFVLYIVQMYS